jgi:subtilisin family serine protease
MFILYKIYNIFLFSIKGRQGKGTVFVWASGNGGASGDDCGADGYVSHQYVISIGSLNHLGKTTYFDEFCPSTMAVAYTGGRHARSMSEESLSIGVCAADVDGKCTTNFFGTSAAAPVAAGALALVLEANPELGYRDVMYIIAETARIPSLDETDGWIINGAGYHVNDKFGFGVLDVGQMTALAQKWTNVQARYECYHEFKDVRR